MQKRPLDFQSGKDNFRRREATRPTHYDAVPIDELSRQADRWLRDCRMRGHTQASQDFNQLIVNKVIWFLRREKYSDCGEDELSDFLLYLQEAHLTPYGRWGDGEKEISSRAFKPLSRSSILTYYRYLKIIFSWLCDRDVLEVSPMRRIKPPECQENQREGFNEDEFNSLLEAASQTTNGKRDRALLLFMIDSGARASEVCAIRMEDIDLDQQRILLHGKGKKNRQVYVGVRTTRAIYEYLQQGRRDVERDAHEPLFLSRTGEALGTSGLLCLFRRLRKAAGLRGKCYPHMMRRTFATEFLAAGAPIKDVQRQMGHSTSKQTMEYLYSSEIRLQDTHRRFSPADRIRSKNR